MNRLVGFEHEQRLRDLTAARRTGATSVSIRSRRAGLAVFDGGGASEKVRLNPKAPPSESDPGPRSATGLRNRARRACRTLAENTDGIAIVLHQRLAKPA